MHSQGRKQYKQLNQQIKKEREAAIAEHSTLNKFTELTELDWW